MSMFSWASTQIGKISPGLDAGLGASSARVKNKSSVYDADIN
jgi:hypothetical protein